MSEAPKDNYIVKPVMKALRVLELVAEQGQYVSLHTICKSSGIPKTTTFRYLQTLVQAGFLDHDRVRDRYSVGHRFRSIAEADTSLNRLRQIARPYMQGLLDSFDETVNLAVAAENQVVYIDIVDSTRPLRIQARIGARHPMHSTALGKAMLAYMPSAERQAYFDHPLTEMTGRTMLEQQEIERQLRQIVKTGYSTETGENEDEAMCIGAPILDTENYPIAAISISAPLHRMSREKAVEVGAVVASAAQAVSIRMGANLEK